MSAAVAFGPDLWGNAPDASEPIESLRAFLATIDAAVATWPSGVKAQQGIWLPRIDAVRTQIADALAALPLGSVFAGNSGVLAYDTALHAYQQLKDQLTLSPDFYLTDREQADAAAPAGSFFDDAINKGYAVARLFGVWIVLAIVAFIIVHQGARKAFT